jgi:predicted nucleic-acid-binding protein
MGLLRTHGQSKWRLPAYLTAIATEIISSRLTEEETGFVSLVTILEVVRVLKSLYRRSREEIANDIEMVLAADTLQVQNEQEVHPAVVAPRSGTGTFEYALIGSRSSE